MARSSIRLGHGPLKAERRVRFPYALPCSLPGRPPQPRAAWETAKHDARVVDEVDDRGPAGLFAKPGQRARIPGDFPLRIFAEQRGDLDRLRTAAHSFWRIVLSNREPRQSDPFREFERFAVGKSGHVARSDYFNLPIASFPPLLVLPKQCKFEHRADGPLSGWKIREPKVQSTLMGRAGTVGVCPTIR